MDFRRLIPRVKFPSLHPHRSVSADGKQRSASSDNRSDLRSFLPVIAALALFIVLILASWWISPYFDSLYSLIPGYYHIDRYNDITSEKNDINDEMFQLYAQLTSLEEQYNSIVASTDGYAQMRDVDSDRLVILEDLHALLERAVELDEELLTLRLPTVVQQYVELSSDLDEIRIEVNELSLEVSRARRDLNELRLLRTDFDDCLLAIDWSSSEAAISESIFLCTAKVPPIQEKVGQMEIEYDAELASLSQYLVLLKEEWDAEAMYYQNIANRDYTKAREYDDIFADRKRQISEMDVVGAFGEFTSETLGPMQEDLVELREKAALKEKTATQWYDNNVKRGN